MNALHSKRVWPSQLTALHALFALYAPRFLGTAGASIDRKKRLAWASDHIGRTLESFSDLTQDDAARLIVLMKKALGQDIADFAQTALMSHWKPGQRPASFRRRRRRPNRDEARAYGTAGRSDQASNEIRLVDAPTLELLDSLIAQLGWTAARFDAFLHSTSSPVSSGAIRTLREANRAIWALKNMLRRADKGQPTTSVSDQRSFDFAPQREEG